MAIKDILVCLDASEASDCRLKLSADLARKHEAYLTAACVLPDPEATVRRLYGPGAIGIGIAGLAGLHAGEQEGDGSSAGQGQDAPEAVLAETSAMRFRETLRLNGIRGDWQLFEPGEEEELIALTATADVVVIGQHYPEAPAEFRPEKIVMACGRPLLVLPHAGSITSIGKRVLVAWDGTREAARAMHDALPLINGAEAVTVISVGSRESDVERWRLSLDRVVRHLERHGLAAVAMDDVQDGIAVSDVLLSRVSDLGADLIVAGAYLHFQIREAAVGGVSRELLDHSTVPVLISH